MNERIISIMSEAFDVPEEVINENTSQDNIETWDSLHHIRMIVLLEREFDISIPDQEVGKMVNFKLIKLIVEKCHESQIQ